MGRGRLRPAAACSTTPPASGRARSPTSTAPARCPAATTGRTPPPPTPPARALGIAARGRGRGPAELPRPGPPDGDRRRASAASASSTTARPPTPTPRARRCRSYPAFRWIAGGRAKAGGIDRLADLFPRVAKAYLIGEAARRLRSRPRGQGDEPARGERCEAAVAAGLRRRRGERRGGQSSCFARPAPPSTSSPTSRRAARPSAPPSTRLASECRGVGDRMTVQHSTPSPAPTARAVGRVVVDHRPLAAGRRRRR